MMKCTVLWLHLFLEKETERQFKDS